jgi:hypothetical protein
MQPKGDVKELMDWAESVGWRRIADGKGHFRMAWGIGGATVTIPQTPSDCRSLLNTRSDMERLSGVRADRRPAARYRHTGRRTGFDMDAALAEQEANATRRERQQRWQLRQQALKEAARNGRVLTPEEIRQIGT